MPQIIPAVAAAVSWVSSAAAAASAAVVGWMATPFVMAMGEGAAIAMASGVLKVAATALGSYALNAVMAPKVGGGGSPTQFKADPQSPIRGVMGRFGTSGTQAHMRVWGKNNLMISYMVILSLGPIQGVEKFTANGLQVNFPLPNGLAANIEPYKDKMWMTYKNGLPTDGSLMPPPTGGTPSMEWSANHKTSGYAGAFWTMQNNSKRASYEGGVPKPVWTLNGMLCYDPRLDSTQTEIGGSGPHRVDDWRTWTYSQNPQIHAINWALGHFKKLPAGIIDRNFLLAGIGAPITSLHLPTLVAGANVSDANGWKICGEWNTQDDKWNTFASMLQAGGSAPIHVGAKIGIMTNAPRVPVATITDEDVTGNLNIKVMASSRDRFNTIYPMYISEPNGWEYATAGAVTSTVYQAEDGGEERSKEMKYNFVGQSKQARELAAYDLANTRETMKLAFPAKPYLIGVRAGDAVNVDMPRRGIVGKFIVLARPLELGEGGISFELRSESDAKHAWALGQTDQPAPSPSLSPFDPSPAPPEGWSVAPRPADGDGSQQPSLVVTGEVPDGIGSVVFEVSKAAVGPWRQIYSGPPTTEQISVDGLSPNEQYWVGVTYYSIDGKPSDRTVYGPYTAPAFIASESAVVTFPDGTSPIWDYDTVADLPVPPIEGQTKAFVRENGKLYSWNDVTEEWEATVADATIADGSITNVKFAAGLQASGLGPTLPTLPSVLWPVGSMYTLTTTGVTYTNRGGAWSADIVSSQVPDSIITAPKIADNAVTNSKIVDGAVISGKIANGAVTSEKIVDGAVTAVKIVDGSVIAGKIASNAVTAVKIAEGAVTHEKIAANAIEADNVAANSITAVKIAAGAVESDKILANAVTAGKIASNAVTADKIEANAVTAVKIASSAITSDKIAANAIVAGKIAAGAATFETLAVQMAGGDNLVLNNTFTGESYALNSNLTTPPTGWSRLFTNGNSFQIYDNVTDSPAARGMRMSRLAGATGELSITSGVANFSNASSWSEGAIEVNNGDEIFIETWIKQSIANIAVVDIVARDSAGINNANFVVTHIENGSGNNQSSTFIGAPNVWARHKISVRYNGAEARKLFVRYQVGTSASAFTVHWCLPRIMRRKDANLIVDGSITTTKLQVGDYSNLVNDSFSDPLAWTFQAANAAFETGNALDGGRTTWRWTRSRTGQTANAYEGEANSRQFAVKGVSQYFAEVNLRTTAGFVGSSQLMLIWFKADGTAASPASTTVASTTNPASGSQVLRGIATAPADAAFANLRLRQSADATGTYTSGAYHSDPVVRRAASGELIVDGAITAGKIDAGAITADKIATNAVTAGKIAAGAITTDKLAANAITSDKITANAVVASKLAIGDTSNMIVDPDFRDDQSWALGSTAIIETSPVSGVSRRLSHTGTTNENTYGTYVTVEGGAEYYLSAFLQYGAGTVGGAGGYVYLTTGIADASGTVTSVQHQLVNSSAFNSTTRSSVGTIVTVPAGHNVGRFRLRRISGGTAPLHMDTPVLRKAASGELIVNGAITTDKLAANSVVAGKVAAGAITATAIAARAVTTSKLLVVPDNLCPDPDFQDNDFWNIPQANQWWKESSANGHPASVYGNYMALWSGNFTFSGTKALYSDMLPRGSIAAGRKIRITCGMVNSSNASVSCALEFLDATGGWLGGAYANAAPSSGPNANVQSPEYTVPNNAVDARFVLIAQVASGNFSGSCLIGNISAFELASAGMIVNGAITAEKIAANAVTADKIIAGAVTANKINVTSLSAITANLGTVTTGRLQNAANTTWFDLASAKSTACASRAG